MVRRGFEILLSEIETPDYVAHKSYLRHVNLHMHYAHAQRAHTTKTRPRTHHIYDNILYYMHLWCNNNTNTCIYIYIYIHIHIELTYHLSLSLYIYIYMYMYYTYVCIYIYIYIHSTSLSLYIYIYTHTYTQPRSQDAVGPLHGAPRALLPGGSNKYYDIVHIVVIL